MKNVCLFKVCGENYMRPIKNTQKSGRKPTKDTSASREIKCGQMIEKKQIDGESKITGMKTYFFKFLYILVIMIFRMSTARLLFSHFFGV